MDYILNGGETMKKYTLTELLDMDDKAFDSRNFTMLYSRERSQ